MIEVKKCNRIARSRNEDKVAAAAATFYSTEIFIETENEKVLFICCLFYFGRKGETQWAVTALRVDIFSGCKTAKI